MLSEGIGCRPAKLGGAVSSSTGGGQSAAALDPQGSLKYSKSDKVWHLSPVQLYRMCISKCCILQIALLMSPSQ